MPDNIRQYTTIGGERWDSIATARYGDPFKMGDLIAANPDIPFYDVFPQGVIVNVPIIEKVEVKTSLEQSVPWKQ
ncbi:tail protein X [Chitinophaga sp. CF418]|uniref:tail protein X n=1 Tax=Chitinophaga sp. CF418 TaxID=1855287 RepID=UPI000918F4B7|nr:tail protein X [Chitinophaga sp. CF418]SHN42232.1 Phage Tail Protein X [Chitinophaga sp. CF418]